MKCQANAGVPDDGDHPTVFVECQNTAMRVITDHGGMWICGPHWDEARRKAKRNVMIWRGQ